MTSEGQHSGQSAEATSGEGFPPDTDDHRTPGRASVPADGFPHSYGPPPQATPNGGSPFVVPAVPPFGQASAGAPADRYGVPATPPPAGPPPTGSARVPQGSARVPQPSDAGYPAFPASADAPGSAGSPGFPGTPGPGGSSGFPGAPGPGGSAGFPGGAAPSGETAPPSAWAPPPSANASSSSEDNPFDSHPYRAGGVSGGPLNDQRSDFSGFAPGSPTRGRIDPDSSTPGPMWGAAFDPAAESRPPAGVPTGSDTYSSASEYSSPGPESDEPDPSGGRPPGLSAFGDQRVRVPGATLTGLPDAIGFPPRPPAGGAEIIDRSGEGNALPRRVASEDPTGFGANSSGNSTGLPRPADPDASGRRLTSDLPIRGSRPEFGGGPSGGESMFGFTPSSGRPPGTGPAETAQPTGPASAPIQPTFGDTPFGDQSSRGNETPFGNQPARGNDAPFGNQPGRGNQPLFGEQPGWGESGDRGDLPRRDDQPFGGSPAARPEAFGHTPFGAPSPAGDPAAARQEPPAGEPSPFGSPPATRQDPFGRAEPFSDPSATPEPHPGTSYGSPATQQDPFGRPESPATQQDPFGRAEAFGGSPAHWQEPPTSGSSAFGGSPAAAQASPAYGAGGPAQSDLGQNDLGQRSQGNGPGSSQGPGVRHSTAYGSPVQPTAEPGEDRNSPFGASPGMDPSPFGSPATAPESTAPSSYPPGNDGTSQSPYAASYDSAGQSPYAPGNNGPGQSAFAPGNDGLGQSPYALGNDGSSQSLYAPDNGHYAPGSDDAGQPLYGRGNDGAADSPYSSGRSGNDDLYRRPQPDGFAAGSPDDRRSEPEEDDSNAPGDSGSGGFPQRTPGASLGSMGAAPESLGGVPAPRDPADAGGPTMGTARPVSASASVPMASRVGPAEGEELPPPAKAPQSRVYGRPVQPPVEDDDAASSAPVSPFARPGGERFSADPIGGNSQDLPPLGPKTPPPGGNPVPARATASARVVSPPAPGQDGPGYAPPGNTSPDSYGEDTTDMVGRRQPTDQPYVPAPALPSMHARPPLVDGFPPAPGAENAPQWQPAGDRPRLGGVFPGPGGAGPAFEPGVQSRATVTPPPGPDETSSWPGPAGATADSDQSRFEQFKPDTETPAKPENTSVRRLPLVLLVVLGAVLVVGVPIGIVWLIGRGSDNGFSASVGDCVKPSGTEAVKANCSDPGTFSVVSIVDAKEQCPDPEQPYVQNPTSGGKNQILCLKPSS